MFRCRPEGRASRAPRWLSGHGVGGWIETEGETLAAWLHFVGRGYYSLKKFTREAHELRITRRIDRRTLARVEFGDVVYLGMRSGKTPILFGKFVVSSVAGMSTAEIDAAAACWELRCVDIGGQMIERECGEYLAGPTFELVGKSVTIKGLLEKIEDAPPDDRGQLMVGGDLIETEPVRLASMKGRLPRGFRPFDADLFRVAVNGTPAPARGMKSVKGFFYVLDRDAPPSNVVELDEQRARRVQAAYGYQQKGAKR